MKYYVAPLEAITGYVFRTVHHRHFPGADQYYIPFIEPKPNARKTWTGRTWNDICPEHNVGIHVVPQILTNKWEDFLWTAEKLGDLGYTEVNLNLGCPSRTVVSKNRGSGFLADPEELDAFLFYIFKQCKLSVSIKTRIGRDDPEEFEQILKIYEKYPLQELIIHPRTQKDYYNQPLHMDAFAKACNDSRLSIGYNGEIVTLPDYERLNKAFPQLNSCMCGRGILRNPQLIECIQKGTTPDRKRISEYHTDLLDTYRSVLSGDATVLYHMKEVWCYMGKLFDDPDKYIKKMLKTKKLEEFKHLSDHVLSNCDFSPEETKESAGIWSFKDY